MLFLHDHIAQERRDAGAYSTLGNLAQERRGVINVYCNLMFQKARDPPAKKTKTCKASSAYVLLYVHYTRVRFVYTFVAARSRRSSVCKHKARESSIPRQVERHGIVLSLCLDIIALYCLNQCNSALLRNKIALRTGFLIYIYIYIEFSMERQQQSYTIIDTPVRMFWADFRSEIHARF